MKTILWNRAMAPLRQIGGVLAACILLLTVSLQAQDAPEDMSVAAYEAAKADAAKTAAKQAATKHAADIALLAAVKMRAKIGTPVTVTVITIRRNVTGTLYDISGSGDNLYVKIGDRKIGLGDLSPADQLRMKHANMTDKQVDAAIQEMEEELAHKLQKTTDVNVDKLVERRGYTRAFMENTVIMNGNFYFEEHLGHKWYPVLVQKLPRDQDPMNRFVSISIPTNKLKVPAQIVIFLDGQAVATRRDVLDKGGWNNVSVTVPRSMLVPIPEPPPAAEGEVAPKRREATQEEIQAATLERLKVRVYLLNAGHWDLKTIGFNRLGPNDLAACALMFHRENIVDAKGHVEAEVKEFAEYTKAAADLQLQVAEQMAAALEEYAKEKEKIDKIREEEEAEEIRLAEQKKAEAEILADIELRTSGWFHANKLPQTSVLGDKLVNANEVRGPAEFPFTIDGKTIKRVGPWYHENDVRHRDLKEKNFQFVGMKYRFMQLDTPEGAQPEFLIQAALFFNNRATNQPVTVKPRLTFIIKDIDNAPDFVKLQPGRVTINYAYTVQPNWSGFLVGATRISISQLYRRVGDLDYDLDPKDEPVAVPAEGADAAEATPATAPAPGTDDTAEAG